MHRFFNGLVALVAVTQPQGLNGTQSRETSHHQLMEIISFHRFHCDPRLNRGTGQFTVLMPAELTDRLAAVGEMHFVDLLRTRVLENTVGRNDSRCDSLP